jgi:2-polyprenyl-3-methyl-5-hydroxy-6-metoxy-1,4-benzoquinol methylase
MDTCSPAGTDRLLPERTVAGLHPALFKKLPALDHSTPILDLGCGSGAWLERLAVAGFNDLHGVEADLSQFRSRHARCYQANLDFDPDLGLGAKKFGLITAIELIEHLENPGRFFYHVSRYLADDGYLLLTSPNIHSVLCRFRFLITGKLKQFDEKGDQTHIYPIFLPTLERILPRYGLEICEKWPYPLDGSSLTSRRALKFLAGLLGKVLPNPDPGDILCLLIRRKQTGQL